MLWKVFLWKVVENLLWKNRYIALYGMKYGDTNYMFYMVRKERLELSRLTALEPKSSASTNSATFAFGALKTPRGAHYNRAIPNSE